MLRYSISFNAIFSFFLYFDAIFCMHLYQLISIDSNLWMIHCTWKHLFLYSFVVHCIHLKPNTVIFVMWRRQPTVSANNNRSFVFTTVRFLLHDKSFQKWLKIFLLAERILCCDWLRLLFTKWRGIWQMKTLNFSVHEEQTTLWDPTHNSYQNRKGRIRNCWIGPSSVTCANKSWAIKIHCIYMLR